MMDRDDKELREKIRTALMKFAVACLIKDYTLECLTVGVVKPGDKLPIDKYIDDLEIYCPHKNGIYEMMQEYVTDGHGNIINKPLETYIFEFYISKMDLMFYDAPQAREGTYEDDILPYKYGLHEYLINLFPLFLAIVNTKVKYEPFDIEYQVLDKEEKKANNQKAVKFIKAIKYHKLRQGGRIDRYVKGLPLSICLQKLVKSSKGHFILKNSDTDSLDYKLALFSAMYFNGKENETLFELKIVEWLKQQQNNL